MKDLMRVFAPGGMGGPRFNRCCGALLRVSLPDYRELERGGVRWETPTRDIPASGTTAARVRCDQDEVRLERGGLNYGFGLCSSCMEMESRQRQAMGDVK